MAVVTIDEAKKNLSRLIKKVEAGEEIVISRQGKPVARLVPIVDVKGKRQPGLLKDKLVVGPEFFEPLPGQESAFWK